MVSTHKTNCWEAKACDHGPSTREPCPAALDATSTGVNGGFNAGRICWTVPGTGCDGVPQGDFVDKQEVCLSCGFFVRVREEEGAVFRFVKLAQGVRDVDGLHARIEQVESLMGVHDRLHATFNLDAVIAETTRQARTLTQAQRSLVLLLRGNPPRLHGQFRLRGRVVKVDIPLDDTSAVGYAALANKVVNVKDPYKDRDPQDRAPFNQSFDRACECRTNSLLAVPVRDSDNRVLGVITAANSAKGYFSHDDQWFIERYAVEVGLAIEKARLLESEVAMGRMASISESLAGLSHFLKDVAHALIGTSYIIRRGIERDRMEDVKAAWEILDRHVKRLADLCKDVLTYDPERPDEMCPGDLSETVADAVSLLQGEARTRAIRLEARLHPGLTQCCHSKRGIYRCIVNLVVNAFDACPPSGGHVMVTAQCRDEHAVVAVSDNGHGMDAETRERMLETFKTGDKTRGSGIGLPTVADIVERHGGRLETDSEPDRGSTFTIVLPLTGARAPNQLQSRGLADEGRRSA
ncbi:MAG: GAF domain-containing sensor histidine kinase [Armatimonadota bacterium]|nr:MAG: GAF domain-containing sensor histidine kinase [Armatimonadota bacterium]